jgi:LytR cell envelope-related transcriptional attenuator
MPGPLRTTITLVALGALLVAAAVWGWSVATDSLPAKVDQAVCVDTDVTAGDKLYPQQVTVSVYNASDRAGLASQTMRELADRGFSSGSLGNVTRTRVPYAEIWSTEPTSPAVQLVASQLGDVDVERRDGLGPGVTLVVGDRFGDLAAGEPSVQVTEDATICSPPLD